MDLHVTSDGQGRLLLKLQKPAPSDADKEETHDFTSRIQGKTHLASGQQLDGCLNHQATRGAHDYTGTLFPCRALQFQPPGGFVAQSAPPGC